MRVGRVCDVEPSDKQATARLRCSLGTVQEHRNAFDRPTDAHVVAEKNDHPKRCFGESRHPPSERLPPACRYIPGCGPRRPHRGIHRCRWLRCCAPATITASGQHRRQHRGRGSRPAPATPPRAQRDGLRTRGRGRGHQRGRHPDEWPTSGRGCQHGSHGGLHQRGPYRKISTPYYCRLHRTFRQYRCAIARAASAFAAEALLAQLMTALSCRTAVRHVIGQWQLWAGWELTRPTDVACMLNSCRN